jgi:hypothetical protein
MSISEPDLSSALPERPLPPPNFDRPLGLSRQSAIVG